MLRVSKLLSRNARNFAPVNLDRIQHWIDQGRLTSSPENPITVRDLLKSGCIHSAHDGVKVLGDVNYFFLPFQCLAHSFLVQGAEHLKSPLYIIASRASQSAIKAIEERGGKVVCKYYNALALRDCLEGRIDRISAAPTRREDISKLTALPTNTSCSLRSTVFYSSHRNRGFISPKTLEVLKDIPFVEERWKALATELGGWKRLTSLTENVH